MAPIDHSIDGFANEIRRRLKAFLFHPIFHALDHAFDDAEAVVHHRGANLHAGGAKQHELHRVLPALNAADAADGNAKRFAVLLAIRARHQRVHFRIAGDLIHHVQRNRLHRRTAIAAVRRFSPHRRSRRECVKIDAGDRVDGVDQRDRISAATRGSTRNVANIRNVRRELDDHGGLGDFFYPLDDHAGVIRHLSDRRAHTAFAHAVRATEVKLKPVAAGVLGALHNLVPRFAFGFDHQRDDERVVRIPLFDVGDFTKINFNGPVGDQLDVVESHHALIGVMYRRVAAGDVDNRLANGFPNGAAPTGIKRARDLISTVGRRRRGQPKRVGGFDSAEVDAEIGHGIPHVFSNLVALNCARIAPQYFCETCAKFIMHLYPAYKFSPHLRHIRVRFNTAK